VAKAKRPPPLVIGGVSVAAGERRTIELPLSRVFSHLDLNMPVQVIRGRQAGPVLCVSAGVHGDELNGVEIVRRLTTQPALDRIKGTLIAVPIVNVFGFIHQTRYLPDRRDLNRSFPGSETGSLTARLAHLFMQEVVSHCDYGIDLHTGALHRSNLPQIRAALENEQTERLAKAFGTPVIIDSRIRDGSLREALHERGLAMLLYEAGEALRFDEVSIRAGVRGVLAVMRELAMLPASRSRRRRSEPSIALDTSWVRAPNSGLLHPHVGLGARVRRGDSLGTVVSPFGEPATSLTSPIGGIVIGMSQIPLLNEGDAAVHIAQVDRPQRVERAVEAFHDRYQGTPADDNED
jgi:predicted deacylase